MESYGELLKKTREQKNLDAETISRDTSITVQYLKALEEEDLSIFPGEPYYVGFLKIYAEYLGISTEKVLTLYNAKKLQETPPPIELTKREKQRFLIPLIVIGIIIFITGIAVGIILFIKSRPKPAENYTTISKNINIKKYELTEDVLTERLFKGDQLILSNNGGNIILTVAETANCFGLETPAGIQYVQLSEEIELDVDGNGLAEIIVYVSDVSSTDVDRGAEVRIMLRDSANAAIAAPDESQILKVENLPKDKKWIEILSDNRAYPFTIKATFRSGSLFRYKADRKDVIEDFIGKGEVVEIHPSNGARIWISNGYVVKMEVIANLKTYDLNFSKEGEVVVEDIKWIKDTDGRYKLVVLNVD